MSDYAKKGAEIENGVLTEARRQLCFELVGDFNKLDDEQRTQATEALQNVASAIGLTADARSAEALVSKDKGFVESVIIELREREGLAYLAVAILLHIVISNRLFRSLYGHHTAAMYIRDIDRRLGLYPSKVRFMVCIGQAFCEHWPELLCGVGDEPGIPLGELALRHRAKLSVYLSVRGICGARDALRFLKTDTFAVFRDRIHANDLPKQENAAVEGTGTTAASACTPEGQPDAAAGSTDTTPVNAEAPAEGTPPQASSPRTFADEHPTYIQAMAGFNEHQITATRIVQRGGRPYLAVADRPEYLEGLEGRIESRRHAVNETQRERIGHVAFEPQYALSINDALFKLDNVHDIEDRIRIGLAGVADDRRTIAVRSPYSWHGLSPRRSSAICGRASTAHSPATLVCALASTRNSRTF
jgi:hypothetical protein